LRANPYSMRIAFTQFLLGICFLLQAQVPPYYSSLNLSDSAAALKGQLSNLIINTHTTFLSYTPGVWNVLEEADLDLIDNTKVLLLYGYSDSDGNPLTDRTRDVALRNTGQSGAGTWNREHVFPISLGTPNLGNSGPGSDAHHLRACDTQMNANRGNRPFALGSGNPAAVGQNWYPGDEWKGDVARMIMYMYLRYPTQCIASNVGVGPITYSTFDQMPDVFLLWNAEDTVSDFERQRNQEIFQAQGNRNPFIDNPYLAYRIWGGPQITDAWLDPSITLEETANISITVFPNPSNGIVHVSASGIDSFTYTLVDALGNELQKGVYEGGIDLTRFSNGLYLIVLESEKLREYAPVLLSK
jgi:endonuclease I